MGKYYTKMHCGMAIAALSNFDAKLKIALSSFGAKLKIALTGVRSRVRESLAKQLI